MRHLAKLNSNRGVTLVEVMITVLVTCAIAVCVLSLLLGGLDGFNRGTSKAWAETSASTAAQKVAQEIRDGQSATVVGNVLTVTLPQESVDANGEKCYNRGIAGQVRQYYVTAGTTTLKRRVDGVESTVLQRVSAISFVKAANGPSVTITVTGKEQAGTSIQNKQSVSRVLLRNFKS